MSDKTDVTVNENHENDTTEVVATVPALNLRINKIVKVAAASFTAGAAVATLIMKIRESRTSDDTVDVYASEDTLIVTDAQQD